MFIAHRWLYTFCVALAFDLMGAAFIFLGAMNDENMVARLASFTCGIFSLALGTVITLYVYGGERTRRHRMYVGSSAEAERLNTSDAI